MRVIKRTGRQELFSLGKISLTLNRLAVGLDSELLTGETVLSQIEQAVTDNITTVELNTLAAETIASFATHNPDFSILAGRVEVSGLHKETDEEFSRVLSSLRARGSKPDNGALVLSDEILNVATANEDTLNKAIVHKRDYDFDYFGVKTLMKSYLLRREDGKIGERPQHMFMRVALGIHGDDIERVLETYGYISRGFFIHATPTLFNAGTKHSQMSSCFLACMKSDTIDGIYDTLKDCAVISKFGGGVGLSISDIPSSSEASGGVIPMLRVFNNSARYVVQSGGKRKGNIAIYIEPWHLDIFAFLDLKKNNGNEMERARDLFYALWIPDLFMKRVEANENWTLFCPGECKGLETCWGDSFTALYEKYENEGKGKKVVNSRLLWYAIISSQVETGTPYMLYKDHCNKKSNQQNLGTIRCSNLCAEIVQFTDPTEVAVCNLASLSLPRFLSTDGEGKKVFDFLLLKEITKVVARNLDCLIDRNFYPLDAAKLSNMRHRPIGIGVQGLADVFQILRLPFESSEARKINKDIFETIYFGACEASMGLASIHGPYTSYQGSPASNGQLQFDLWGVRPSFWDWTDLKAQISKHGLRNSLLVAVMPTASTAQIFGNNEGVEPFLSNMFTRRVNAGEYILTNKHLVRELASAGLWSETMRNRIIANRGSIQSIETIPRPIRAVFKTAWEISQRCVLHLAADRGAFVCQSQSLNIHMEQPNISKMTSLHFCSWKMGLKTGMYYLRSRPLADAIPFTVQDLTLLLDRSLVERTSVPNHGEEISGHALGCRPQQDCKECCGA